MGSPRPPEGRPRCRCPIASKGSPSARRTSPSTSRTSRTGRTCRTGRLGRTCPAGRTCRLGDRGSATAEFAIVLPAIVLVLAMGIGALSTSALAVRLQDGAAGAARLLGRDETPDAAAAALAGTAPGAAMSVDRDGALVCVTASAASGLPFLPALHARSCALAGGR